jgi:hypothetical protein
MTRFALALAVGLAALAPAAADPGGELGRSAKARVWWDDAPAPEVTPIWAVSRHGHLFVYEWEASIDGIPIDHDRFYELVGRQDLARRAKLHRALGVLAIVGGVAAAAFGTRGVLEDHPSGFALLFGGTLVSFAGAYLVLAPDPTSASEAQQLASDRRVVVGLGTKF